jgi:hypothetical protein
MYGQGGGMFDGADMVAGPPANFLHSFSGMGILNCIGCCCMLILWIIIAVLTGEALKTSGFSQPPDLSEKWQVTQLPNWVYMNMNSMLYNSATILGDAWSTCLILIILSLLAYFAMRFRDGQVIKSISFCAGGCSACYCCMMIASIVFTILIGLCVSALEDITKLCDPAQTEGLKVVQEGTETTSISPTSVADCEKLMTELKTPFTLTLVSMVGCCCMMMCWTAACGFAAKEGMTTAQIMDGESGYGSYEGSSYYG